MHFKSVLPLLLVLPSCKYSKPSSVSDLPYKEDLDGLANKDSAAALGLKLVRPYRINVVCLPSLTGEGMVDVAKACPATQAYIQLQCGAEVQVSIHDNPSLVELDLISKRQAEEKIDGFWIVEAHGELNTVNQLHKVDKSSGRNELIPTEAILEPIRNHDQRGVWIAACYSEIANPKYKDVGYSARNYQKSSNTTFRPVNAPSSLGPDFSTVYLIDQLCSVYAKDRDKDGNGSLDGSEMDTEPPVETTKVMTLDAYRDFSEKFVPSRYVIQEMRSGYLISSMTCEDRLGGKQVLGYRGEQEDVFFNDENAARELFFKRKPVENESATSNTIQPTRLTIADRSDDRPFIDRIRIAEGFPNTFKVGRDKNSLEVLTKCQPNIVQGVWFQSQSSLRPSIPVIGGGGQDAVPADFELPLPIWR